MVLSFPCLSPMQYASAKKSVKKTNLRITHNTQTKDVLSNPPNPVNPDSKPSEKGKFILKPIGEKEAKARVSTMIAIVS